MKKIFLTLLNVLGKYTFADIHNGITNYQQGNYHDAFRIFKASANEGNAQGMHLLASMYFQGHGVPKDTTKSLAWFTKAANNDYIPAIMNLGLIYTNGDGTKKDLRKAFGFYRQAAKLGDTDSAFFIGQGYAQGKGTVRNFEKAITWYRKAATAGHAHAQNDLGLLYAQGLGVQQDYVTAYAWIHTSVINGNDVATSNKNKLLELLNTQEHEAACELALLFEQNYASQSGTKKEHHTVF